MKYPDNANASKIFTKKTLAIALVAGGLAFSVHAQDPTEQPDESWISLAGTVTSTTPDSFRLDYGDGMITVEMETGILSATLGR